MNLFYRLLCLALLFQISHLAAEALHWRVSKISGEVQISRADSTPILLNRQDTFGPGQKILTGSASTIALVRGQQAILLFQNSEIEIPSAKSENSRSFTTFFQTLGTIIYSVKKSASRQFKVRTPFAAAVVKGTTFAINISKETFHLQVFEGSVELKKHNTHETQLITPSAKATINRRTPNKVTVIRPSENPPKNPHFGNDIDKIEKYYTDKVTIGNQLKSRAATNNSKASSKNSAKASANNSSNASSNNSSNASANNSSANASANNSSANASANNSSANASANSNSKASSSRGNGKSSK